MAEQSRRILRVPSHRQLIRADLKGKNVLARFDFNIPLKDGEVADAKRIDAALPTLRKIIDKGAARLSIICHLGRPVFDSPSTVSSRSSLSLRAHPSESKTGRSNREAQTRGDGKPTEEFSVKPIAKILCDRLNVKFNKNSESVTSKYLSLGKYFEIGKTVRLYENLRFDKEEEKNNSDFARALSELGDVFIQDAFANIHRDHASMVGISKILPTYAGLLVEKEVNNLFRILSEPKEPFIALIGGAKVKDKLPIIEALAKRCEAVIIGGMTANEWILEGHPKTGNIYLPTDGINKFGSIVPINEATLNSGIFDIGPQTIMLYKSILTTAKTIFWNGNLGMTENKRFVHGTYEIARFIAKLQVEKVASGGNTVEVIDHLKLGGSFNFISTGGGATSDFIIGKKLPALEILLK